jgi:hypothetical protein
MANGRERLKEGGELPKKREKGLCCKNEGVMINASLFGARQRSFSS